MTLKIPLNQSKSPLNFNAGISHQLQMLSYTRPITSLQKLIRKLDKNLGQLSALHFLFVSMVKDLSRLFLC